MSFSDDPDWESGTDARQRIAARCAEMEEEDRRRDLRKVIRRAVDRINGGEP
jgi:hypothetical protein